VNAIKTRTSNIELPSLSRRATNVELRGKPEVHGKAGAVLQIGNWELGIEEEQGAPSVKGLNGVKSGPLTVPRGDKASDKVRDDSGKPPSFFKYAFPRHVTAWQGLWPVHRIYRS
jgi:hypothetical protein